MKHAQARTIGAFTLVAPFLFMTGCQQDRQMVFTAPRTLPVSASVDRSDPPRKRDAAFKDQPTKTRPLTPSNGVDVPIIDSR